MRIALLQTCSADSPAANVAPIRAMLREAVAGGAGFVLTPEAVNCISTSRRHQQEVLTEEAADPVLRMLCDEAAAAGIWVLAGSILVKTGDPGDGRFANRSLLIAPDGRITARYDKIHLFDVKVSEAETYRESAGIRPGAVAVLAKTDFAPLGLTICYDIRFPQLHRALAQAGARILTVPAAFSPVTGAAHWEVLLRARAIESGAFVLAPAQTGDHPITEGKPRRTFGHSMVVAPWGEVLLDAGTEPGVFLLDLDLAEVASARARVPSLGHDRAFAAPLAFAEGTSLSNPVSGLELGPELCPESGPEKALELGVKPHSKSGAEPGSGLAPETSGVTDRATDPEAGAGYRPEPRAESGL